MTDIRDNVDKKYRNVMAALEDMQSVLVAFSGGVDSTLLLKLARDVLGDRAVAVTAVSATMPRHERRAARRLAEQRADWNKNFLQLLRAYEVALQ